jgi:hypothetical protein
VPIVQPYLSAGSGGVKGARSLRELEELGSLRVEDISTTCECGVLFANRPIECIPKRSQYAQDRTFDPVEPYGAPQSLEQKIKAELRIPEAGIRPQSTRIEPRESLIETEDRTKNLGEVRLFSSARAGAEHGDLRQSHSYRLQQHEATGMKHRHGAVVAHDLLEDPEPLPFSQK